MSLPSPQKFAQILYNSTIPEEAKQIILEKLPTLSKDQIIGIYQILEQEQEKITAAKSEFKTKIDLENIKFEQALLELQSET